MKSGAGTLVLPVNESFTGPVTVNTGTLGVSAPNSLAGALGTCGSITINNGATVNVMSDNALSGSSKAVPIVVNAGGTLAQVNSSSSHYSGVADIGGRFPDGRRRSHRKRRHLRQFRLGRRRRSGRGDGDLHHQCAGSGALPGRGYLHSVAPGAANGIDLDVPGTFYHSGSVAVPDTGLIKAGAGNMRLSSTNSYTGPTVINAGTLSVVGSIASSAVTVTSAGTLAGTGTTGAVTVSGGTLAPGVSGAGSLSLNNNALSLSGMTAMAINASTGASTKVQGISTVTLAVR